MSTSKHHEAQAGDETSAAESRRRQEGFYERYIDDRKVIDIGAGHTPISPSAVVWDHSNGDPDCTFMAGVPDKEYDTVYSSHVLEHLNEPEIALKHWLRILKPNGYLIVSVPDEDLYEQGVWPSIFNPDHRFTYTAFKSQSWNKGVSKNVLDLVRGMEAVKLISLRIIDTNYEYDGKLRDRPHAEKSVEFIVQKLNLVPAWKASLYQGFQCYCGSKEMLFIGMYATGDAMIECRDCHHRAKLPMTKIMEELGFRFEYDKSNQQSSTGDHSRESGTTDKEE